MIARAGDFQELRRGIAVPIGKSGLIVSRTTITAAQLYAILHREFETLRPSACKACRVPLPYWRQAPDDVSANWQITEPSECPHGCHLVISEMLARMWTRYDIEKGYAH